MRSTLDFKRVNWNNIYEDSYYNYFKNHTTDIYTDEKNLNYKIRSKDLSILFIISFLINPNIYDALMFYFCTKILVYDEYDNLICPVGDVNYPLYLYNNLINDYINQYFNIIMIKNNVNIALIYHINDRKFSYVYDNNIDPIIYFPEDVRIPIIFGDDKEKDFAIKKGYLYVIH